MDINIPPEEASSSGDKKIIVTLVLIIAGIILWHYVFQKPPGGIGNSSLAGQVKNIEKQVSAPPPLRGSQNSRNGALSVNGVIVWNNSNRAQNGQLPALTENSLLDAAAQAKLKDMFNQQNFEHINPQGRGPADLAKTAGYEYISIGENLALGNYKNDQDLVTAWMNSPGHRANILNNRYREIGVAVGRGMFEGSVTWLAVQEFGQPASSCPSVDLNLKAQINSLHADIGQIEPQIATLKNQVETDSPQTQADYDAHNQKVAQYNALIKIYNNKVDALKFATDQYNVEVRAYNICAGS